MFADRLAADADLARQIGLPDRALDEEDTQEVEGELKRAALGHGGSLSVWAGLTMRDCLQAR